MPVGQSKALALLQKVNSQLKGERVPLKSKEEDELAVYLSSLTQKTHQPKSVNFEDFGDISISSGTDPRNSATPRGRRSASPASAAHKPSTNKFLKKKKPPDDELKTSVAKSSASPKSAVPASSKIKSAAKLQKQLSVKSESESEGVSKSRSSSNSLAKNGKKILKSKKSDDTRNNLRSPSPLAKSRNSSSDRKKKSPKNEIVRTLGNMYLSSDEESLAEFIHNLSVSDSTARQPKNLVAKKHQKWHKITGQSAAVKSPPPTERSSPFKRSPSPLSRRSRSQSLESDLVDSFDSEISEDIKGRNKYLSLDEPIHVNLKDLSSLASPSPTPRGKRSPVRNPPSSSLSVFRASASLTKADDKSTKKASPKYSKPSPQKSGPKSSLFENLGIHMVDELIDANRARQLTNFDVDISEESEIKTEKSEDGNKMQKQISEQEIVTEIGNSIKKSLRPKSAESASEVSERDWKRKKAVDTDQDYSDSFLTDAESKSETLSKTASQSSTQRSIKDRKTGKERNMLSRRKKHKIIVEEQEVDISTTDQRGTTHHWNTRQSGFLISGPYGLQYVDPKPVATHVVSADALEALTAYSPNMLALQEMMKTQLELVKNFVAIQTRIYQSCMEGLNNNYKYTTLEDTKEYIRQHKRKPLTFKEALKMVEQEEKA